MSRCALGLAALLVVVSCGGNAAADDRHTAQYFEMFGNRGIYHHGWTAVTKHRTPWEMGEGATVPALADDVWELYDTTTDWSQARDLAGEVPEKLAELQQLFLLEAAKYNVFPIDDRTGERFNATIAGRPELQAGRKSMRMGRSGASVRALCADLAESLSDRVDDRLAGGDVNHEVVDVVVAGV